MAIFKDGLDLRRWLYRLACLAAEHEHNKEFRLKCSDVAAQAVYEHVGENETAFDCIMSEYNEKVEYELSKRG